MNSELKRHRVAVMVFAEVDAVDSIDAGHIVVTTIRQRGLWPTATVDCGMPRNMEPRQVWIAEVMEAGMAMQNGFIETQLTPKAFRGRRS